MTLSLPLLVSSAPDGESQPLARPVHDVSPPFYSIDTGAPIRATSPDAHGAFGSADELDRARWDDWPTVSGTDVLLPVVAE